MYCYEKKKTEINVNGGGNMISKLKFCNRS